MRKLLVGEFFPTFSRSKIEKESPVSCILKPLRKADGGANGAIAYVRIKEDKIALLIARLDRYHANLFYKPRLPTFLQQLSNILERYEDQHVLIPRYFSPPSCVSNPLALPSAVPAAAAQPDKRVVEPSRGFCCR